MGTQNYAVYHANKGKSTGGAIGNHIDREEGKDDLGYSSFRHSDPNKKALNRYFQINRYCGIPLEDAIKLRIDEGYRGKKAIRKDAVKFLTHVMTGSHEKMLEISKNKEEFNRWLNANFSFIKKEFGEENIMRFTLHMDETTPHIHAVTVNLTSDGRLSGKEIMGNRLVLISRQDRYAELMKGFGLARGNKNTGIKHESAKEYYSRIKESTEDLEQEKVEISFEIPTINFNSEQTKKRINDKLNEKINPLRTALKAKELEIKNLEKKHKEERDFKDWEINKLKKEKAEQQDKFKKDKLELIKGFSENKNSFERENKHLRGDIWRLLFNDKDGHYHDKLKLERFLTWQQADDKIRHELLELSQKEELKTVMVDDLFRKYVPKVNPTQNIWKTIEEYGERETQKRGKNYDYQEYLNNFIENLNKSRKLREEYLKIERQEKEKHQEPKHEIRTGRKM